MQLARDGRTHPHCDVCAFCREQLEQLRDLMQGRMQGSAEGEGAVRRSFRLAAQSNVGTFEGIRWRQTWYLEDGALLVRVVEDTAEHLLIGYCLCDPARLPGLRLRFSGIDGIFVPDATGRFILGSAGIDVEPMHVMIV